MRDLKFDKAQFRIEDNGSWLMLHIPTEYRQPARAFVHEMNQGKLHVAEIRRYHAKRSSDANRYFWKLCGELAAATGIPKSKIYLEYVKEIGGNYRIFAIENDGVDDWKRIWESRGEGWPCESLGPAQESGYTNMICYFGSSTYNREQMRRLIDFAIYDCKEQGIETATPDEIEKMKARWRSEEDDESV